MLKRYALQVKVFDGLEESVCQLLVNFFFSILQMMTTFGVSEMETTVNSFNVLCVQAKISFLKIPGKLGRGGSDGCKVPMKIESLAGLGVNKVECGSQFSVALTRYDNMKAIDRIETKTFESFFAFSDPVLCTHGAKVIIIAWVTDQSIMCDDRKRLQLYKGRKSFR